MRFLTEFITKPAVTGAVAPSSSYLATTMLESLELEKAGAVVEYGPGTGAFTGHILQQISTGTRFAAIELNPRMADVFRRRYPNVRLFEESVGNARSICDRAGIGWADCIVCGLPWAAFAESMQTEFLDEMMRVLKPGGRFVTFAYVHGLALSPGKRFARLLPRYFAKVSRSRIVWLNIPPAFVYRCQR